jgi:hypothetical protein
MKIISRADWGARPWAAEVYPVAPTSRTEWFAHYHGSPPRHDRGAAMARDVEAIHLANGWAGVGYGHMVGQDGIAYEGRGWGLVGAHCPGHNRSGFSVYFAVGGATRPSAAALTTGRQLYQEACRRAARNLRKTWHGQHWPTDCPGLYLRAWVRDGLPPPPPPLEDPMPLDRADFDKLFATGDAIYQVRDGASLIGLTEAASRQLAILRDLQRRPVVDVDVLARKVVEALPTDASGVSAADIADELAKRLEA